MKYSIKRIFVVTALIGTALAYAKLHITELNFVEFIKAAAMQYADIMAKLVGVELGIEMVHGFPGFFGCVAACITVIFMIVIIVINISALFEWSELNNKKSLLGILKRKWYHLLSDIGVISTKTVWNFD